MDEQDLEATWLFPTLGVGMEQALVRDPEALVAAFHAFNRWLDEDWGLHYHDRIFSAPYITLVDVDAAVAELEWAIERGARIVNVRAAPVHTKEGSKSPADPMFDPFWARADEAGVIVASHAGRQRLRLHRGPVGADRRPHGVPGRTAARHRDPAPRHLRLQRRARSATASSTGSRRCGSRRSRTAPAGSAR